MWPGQRSLGVTSGHHSTQMLLSLPVFEVCPFHGAGRSPGIFHYPLLAAPQSRAEGHVSVQAKNAGAGQEHSAFFPQAALSMGQPTKRPEGLNRGSTSLEHLRKQCPQGARRTKAGPWPPHKEGLDPRCPPRAVVHAAGYVREEMQKCCSP